MAQKGVACGTCYAKKTACDGERPCQRCQRLGLSPCCDRTMEQVEQRRQQKRRKRQRETGAPVQPTDAPSVEPQHMTVSVPRVMVAAGSSATLSSSFPALVQNIALFVRSLMAEAPFFSPRTVKPHIQIPFQMLLNHLAALPLEVEIFPYFRRILPQVRKNLHLNTLEGVNEIIALRTLNVARHMRLPPELQRARDAKNSVLLERIKKYIRPYVGLNKCVSLLPLMTSLDKKILVNEEMVKLIGFSRAEDIGDGWFHVDPITGPIPFVRLLAPYLHRQIMDFVLQDNVQAVSFASHQLPAHHPFASLNPSITAFKCDDPYMILVVIQVDRPKERELLLSLGPSFSGGTSSTLHEIVRDLDLEHTSVLSSAGGAASGSSVEAATENQLDVGWPPPLLMAGAAPLTVVPSSTDSSEQHSVSSGRSSSSPLHDMDSAHPGAGTAGQKRRANTVNVTRVGHAADNSEMKTTDSSSRDSSADVAGMAAGTPDAAPFMMKPSADQDESVSGVDGRFVRFSAGLSVDEAAASASAAAAHAQDMQWAGTGSLPNDSLQNSLSWLAGDGASVDAAAFNTTGSLSPGMSPPPWSSSPWPSMDFESSLQDT